MGRIVVGVDGSPGSRRALEWAVGEAAARHATVEAVHAWRYPYVDPYPFPPPDRSALEDTAREVLDTLVASVDTRGLDAPIEKILVAGPAAHTLLDTSKGADLLVVGSRGHGGFAGLLLGSVSQQVAHHATCPVVIVPSDDG